MAITQKTIDDITRTKTSLDGTERVPARDVDGDFKITVANLQASLSVPSTYYAEASYTVLDDDNYERIEFSTEDGPATGTLPLMANNLGRQITFAFVKNDVSDDVVTISPHATDANTLSNDGLASIILAKVGDFVTFKESSNSGVWEIVNERITSQLRLNTYAGYGSTDNKIMRFTNVVENVGNMFSENHVNGYTGNTKGLEITINRSGRYSISFTTGRYSISFTTGGDSGTGISGGLSLNSNQLTTVIDSITISMSLGYFISATSASFEKNCIIYLKKGDVIRPHTTGQAPSATSRSFFTASYLGN